MGVGEADVSEREVRVAPDCFLEEFYLSRPVFLDVVTRVAQCLRLRVELVSLHVIGQPFCNGRLLVR